MPVITQSVMGACVATLPGGKQQYDCVEVLNAATTIDIDFSIAHSTFTNSTACVQYSYASYGCRVQTMTQM